MKAGRSIIIFSQLYYPESATTSIVMTDLAEDLASYGFQVKVICAQPSYLSKKKCRSFEKRNGVLIKRVWTFLFDKNNILGRILNGTACFVSMLFEAFASHKNSLLVFNTNPALLSFLGFIVHKLRNQRYVILIHDLWPELLAHTGMIKHGGWLYRFIDFLNKRAFKYASAVIVLSNTMKKRILNKVPDKKNEIHVIHNWADVNRIFPVQRAQNQFLDAFDLRHKKVVMYSGNLGRYQPLEVMVKAADQLKNRTDVQFVFIGNGGKKKKIQNLADSMELENVTFLPFQPLDRLAESLSMADVSLMGIYPQNEGVIMPSKLYGLLAVGKPIICVSDPCSEVIRILEKSGAGLQSSIDNPQELAQKVLTILDNPAEAQKMGLNGRKYFLEHFERKMLTKKWKEVLCETLISIPNTRNEIRLNDPESIHTYLDRKKNTAFYIV